MKSIPLCSITLITLVALTACQKGPSIEREWPSYQGGDARNQYSELVQLTADNVAELEVAWTYSAGDLEGRTQIQCNPLIKDGILYGTSPKLSVFALNAATGVELWRFDPNKALHEVGEAINYHVNRGVALWEKGDDKRVFMTLGGWLFCIDANKGKLVSSFGAQGRVSLRKGLGERAQDLYVIATTPGAIFENMLILGTRVSENVDAAPGHIRAFDVSTGEIVWTFHTIPDPGEFGSGTWPEGYHEFAGGANSWSGMSIDRERGIVYIPTGSASFDFYGGNRHGENLFANCILALDARTGERKWHYQTVHHDIWDRDLPAPPNLVTLSIDGKRRDAVAQITKSGHVFVLDRDTGEPLHPIEERAFPPSDVPGEQAWPTQPIPVRPPAFSRQRFDWEDATNISPEANAYVKGILANVRSDGQFIPPSLEGTIIYPGFDGGGEWGGASVDPHTGIMYVNANEMPWIMTLVETNRPDAESGEIKSMSDLGETLYGGRCAFCHGPDRQGDPTGTFPNIQTVGERLKRAEIVEMLKAGKGFMPSFRQLGDMQLNAIVSFLLGEEGGEIDPHAIGLKANDKVLPYSHTGYNRFFDQEGYPAVKPPWGTLNAIDLNKGEILWKVPLGEFDELTERGIPKTGTEGYGGPVATEGGVIFIAASEDEHIRAFEKNTGTELWKYNLPAGGYATPSVYEVDGRQYVVIACGGGKMGTASSDQYIAFALPE